MRSHKASSPARHTRKRLPRVRRHQKEFRLSLHSPHPVANRGADLRECAKYTSNTTPPITRDPAATTAPIFTERGVKSSLIARSPASIKLPPPGNSLNAAPK